MKNLEDQITESLANEMQKTMDFEILADVACRFGWTRLEIDYSVPDKTWIDVVAWVDSNCQGEYKEHLGIWLFELPHEATAFALKWT